MNKVWAKAKEFVERYPVLLAAVVIYSYYLLTSLDLFHHRQKESLIDYFLRFVPLFFLWIAAFALIQVQKFRKTAKRNEEQRRDIERALDRQSAYERLVKEITMMLQDSIYNPLAVISVTAHEMRKKFENDLEMQRWLDRVDTSIQRINNTIRDLQVYEANKILEETASALKEKYSSSTK
jgi:signal transduction histidine kinase